jgi:serine phosphatase RsbU (regulator of sigma subunit)
VAHEQRERDILSRELGYYRRRVDELAGEVLRNDYAISGLRHELKQKRQGLALLTGLQQAFAIEKDLSTIFQMTIRAINATLGMDRTVVLLPAGNETHFRPAHWMGLPAPTGERAPSLVFEFPLEFAQGTGVLLVNKSSRPTPLIEAIRSAFDLPYFVCLPLLVGHDPIALLLSGRLRESRPLYPPLDQGDVDTFRAIADLISASRVAELNRSLEARVEEQIAEMRLASKIQVDLLPKKPPKIGGYDIAGRSIPARMVGGDYFDFIPLEDSRYAICLGDISGKGLSASLLMAHLQATIRGQALLRESPGECLGRSNTLLYRSTDAGKFATLFYGILDVRRHELLYSSAGHNPPLLFSRHERPRLLTTRGMVLGVEEGVTYPEELVPLEAGDSLVLYSDGITEGMNAREEEFGEERLVELVMRGRSETSTMLIEKILAAVREHAGEFPQSDDMTLVSLRRCAI